MLTGDAFQEIHLKRLFSQDSGTRFIGVKERELRIFTHSKMFKIVFLPVMP